MLSHIRPGLVTPMHYWIKNPNTVVKNMMLEWETLVRCAQGSFQGARPVTQPTGSFLVRAAASRSLAGSAARSAPLRMAGWAVLRRGWVTIYIYSKMEPPYFYQSRAQFRHLTALPHPSSASRDGFSRELTGVFPARMKLSCRIAGMGPFCPFSIC
jgi:hypothetical protein